MIKAAKEYFLKENIAFNDKLFLAGYSEGGYVTLSAANAIETTPTDNLTVTAVAAGAGGYDMEEMLSGITTTRYYSYPAYLTFMVMAYNTTYEWNKPLTYFFNQPYADALTLYMNGQYEGSFVNSKLTTAVDELFNAQFFAQLSPPVQDQLLVPAIKMNSIGGWSTQTPIRLYHGTKDEVIPYHNSETTLQKFKDIGNTSVTLTAITNGTHGSSFVPMLKDVIPWFETLR
jgi:dipeptidyl aminopeptidase/acylaminoacyl peptidase